MHALSRRWELGLVGLVVLIAVPFAFMGPGWLLDDWWTLRNAHFDSWWNAAGGDQWMVRPGAAAMYAAFFGIIRSPTAVFVILVALNAVLAVAVSRLFGRFVPAPVAAGVAAMWVLLPNHTTTDYWASAGNLLAAMILSVTGAMALARPDTRSHVVAAGLFAAAALFYEATLALSGLAAVGVPALSGRRRDWRTSLIALAGCATAAIWIVLNWHPSKSVADAQDVTPLFEAHLGWGVLPSPFSEIALTAMFAFLAYSLFGVVSDATGRRFSVIEAGPPERLAVLGLVVMVAGVVPFVRYGYQPIGLGDRANVVSSLGAAMVWAAAGWKAASWRVPFGLALAAAVIPLMLATRFDRAATYARSADDAEAVLDVLEERFPEPGTEVVVGPSPLICDNIVGFFDEENIGPAYQLRMDSEDHWAVISTDAEEFGRPDGRPRLDQHALRPASSECR